MNQLKNLNQQEDESADGAGTPPNDNAAKPYGLQRTESRRWWIKLGVQPALILVAGVLVIVSLGAAQRLGWISAAGGGGGSGHASAGGESTRYICPMMCTPPQSEPGRCPVCAMELVPATSAGGNSDTMSVPIDPAARRVANIRTVAVKAVPSARTIRAIGELSYDEGTLKTLSAYVDGRLDRLYADYTGVVVTQGDHLALLYSPKLYSGQHELLLSKKARDQGPSTTLARVVETRRDLYESSRQRLIELGMTEPQIELLEQDGEANSRIYLCAPISGTVIEKLAVEGQYVKEGQAIYKLADLSTVWIMLELFPEDAATIRYGQKVETEVQSMPGQKFTGRVAFIDPTVDPKTRTVGVRVVMANEDGLLRIGDYAKATIDVVACEMVDSCETLYDPELAGKFISPRHPHIVESSPGECKICGVPLVPASRFGYADRPIRTGEALVVPRNAVLMAGNNSVVYVETEPGRFEIRRVVLGSSSGDEIAILEGVMKGEMVAKSGNFLLDSQMQLAGNPSLIDPAKAVPRSESELDPEKAAEILAALAKLPDADRAAAGKQRICPVTKFPLGSMGAPPKLDVNGRTVFLCCKGCESRMLDEPEKYFAILDQPNQGSGEDDEQSQAITAALAKLSPADRALAEKQRICPVADFPLGAMGTPKKVDVNGTPVFICCNGCRESLLENPEKYLVILAGKAVPEDAEAEAPQSGIPELVWPPIGIPESERDLLEQLHSEALEPKAGDNEQRTSPAFAKLPKETVN